MASPSSPNPSRYLIAVGAVYLDTILTVPYYPGEDEKLRAKSLVRRRGGNCPNTLEVLSQFLTQEEHQKLSKVALIAVLPNRESVAYKTITESMPHVNLKHSPTRDNASEAPSSYIIKSESNGSRTIVNYNELSEMTFQDFRNSFEALREEYQSVYGPGQEDCWCHFEGRIPSVVFECIKYLRSAYPGVMVSVEVEKPAREGLQELANEADVVFYSKSWSVSRGYESAEDCLKQQQLMLERASHLFCTWGSDGAAALETIGKEPVVLPASSPAGSGIVDTIGAGDTFIAGILYGLLEHKGNWDLRSTLSFAIDLAGHKIVQEGFARLNVAVKQ